MRRADHGRRAADFRPATAADQKIKRTGESLAVELVPNEDIIAGLKGDFVKVGFAAETEQMLVHAHAKIKKKASTSSPRTT